MLSAVENFGPSAAAATRAYARHHPFAIAAAAAAAGTAAAAAAAVVPTAQQNNLVHNNSNNSNINNNNYHNSTLSSSPSLSSSPPSSSSSLSPLSPTIQQVNCTGANRVLLPSLNQLQLQSLPSPPSASRPTGTETSILSSQLNNVTATSVAVAMSSAEFARPHPKQPRYNNSSINSNNNISSNNHNNISSNCSNNNNSNNNISSSNNSNGIPLHLRNTNNGGICLTNNATSPSRTKYSSEQSGPVNLVTNNNNNNNNINSNNNNKNNLHNNNNSSINNNISNSSSPSPKDSSLDSINGVSVNSHHSIGTHNSDVMAGIYTQKLPFSTPSVVSNAATAAAVAYHINYTHLYGRGAIYGTPALYPGHHLNSRNQLHNRPTYISGQHEQYSPYLPPPPVTYSPPSVPPPPPGLLGPPPPPSSQQIGLNSPHSTTNLLNNSHNSSSNNNNNNNHSSNNSSAMCGKQPPLHHQMQQQQPSMHHIKQNLINPDMSPSHHSTKDKESKSIAYLNGKICPNPSSIGAVQSAAAIAGITSAGNVAGFKVPSGKEGSLKHRILTRPPYGEKDIRRRSPITATIVRSSSNNNAPTNFTKGSLIELANGELRRVEDMRTEDFVHSAEKSQHLQLADSTVVKITNTPTNVIITFSYNKNRSKVDMEASQEHPFFVYGQGWASCNPELSMQTFGLKCQRLQVGDVCISLIPRESSNIITTPTSPSSSSPFIVPQYKDDVSPQNLSRKSQSNGNIATAPTTIPTTATGIAVTSRLAAPLHLPPPQGATHAPMQHYELMRPYETSPPILNHHLSPPVHSTIPNGIPQQQHHPIHHHRPQQHIMMPDGHFMPTKNNGEPQQSPPTSLSAPPSRPSSNQPYYLGTGDNVCSTGANTGSSHGSANGTDGSHLTIEQQAAVEASLSRKRRWSAPENICDDEGCQPPPHKTMNNNS